MTDHDSKAIQCARAVCLHFCLLSSKSKLQVILQKLAHRCLRNGTTDWVLFQRMAAPIVVLTVALLNHKTVYKKHTNFL